MVDRVPTIDEIDDADKLQAYLETRSVEEVRILQLRLALRVMPIISDLFNQQSLPVGTVKIALLSLFRANLVSWVHCRFPTLEMVDHLNNAASAAAYGAAAVRGLSSVSAAAVETAADATALSGGSSAVYFWVSEALGRKESDLNYALRLVRSDLRALSNMSRDSVLASGLWYNIRKPNWFEDAEDDFRQSILLMDTHWYAIENWYWDVSRGFPPFSNLGEDEKRIIVGIATQSEAFWERDPDEVMKDINSTLSIRIEGDFPLPLMTVSANLEARIDFFISYSTKNETEAREINGYLEEAGYSTIAQFKDFPVGSNFVIEMQEGLERGARAIALLSPDYVVSDHCRAEWAAIYNMDPIGKRRKLVSFLLEPTELNKLQRQIVYSSLVGLKQAARRKAVLDAIRHVPDVVTQNQLKQKLADIASPDVAVAEDGKIDVTPNAKYDLAVNSPDLPDLPTVLRTLCSIIEVSLPENSPKSIGPTFAHYRQHLEERGARPIVGLLGMLVTALTKEFESADFEFWGGGLNEHFESFFACHSKFLGHFPLSGEREQTYAEAEINEDEASGKDLVQPVQNVADAVEELSLIGATTPAFERVVQGQVQIARDVSNLPPNLSEDAGKGNVITPKRRFVLSQLGFWERMLAAVGSMTTLATTPQGQAAIAALQEAISKFLSLIV